jgi:membrane fusion protein (multidrug efflux system)
MKKVLIIATSALFLIACAGQPDKQTELDALKKEKEKIESRIEELEKALASENGTKPEQKPELVQVTPVGTSSFINYVDIQGKVDAEENITVSAQMPGLVKRVLVTEGQSVSKGQLMAELDNEAMKKGIEALETQLAFARDLYNKQKSLWDQKIGTEVQYLSAKTNVETLEKQIAANQEQLELSRITAPFSGVVDEVNLKVGQMASPGYNGIRVVNMGSLKVKGEVSEAYSSSIRTGNPAKIYFPDLQKEVDSKISFVSKVINPQSRTFSTESKLAFDNAYKPNMIAIIKIADYENKSAIVIPVNMIQQAQDSRFVFVATEKGGKKIAERRTIELGRTYNGMAEIKSGLAVNDLLITSGFQELIEGQSIQY